MSSKFKTVSNIRTNLIDTVSQTSDWLSLAGYERRVYCLKYQEEQLSYKDSCRVIDAYCLLALMQYDIRLQFLAESSDTPTLYLNYIYRLLDCRIDEVISQLKAFNSWLKRLIPTKTKVSVRSFKKATESQLGWDRHHPVFELMLPVIYGYISKLRCHSQSEDYKNIFKVLNDFSSFITRLTLEDISTSLNANVQKYVDQEEEMKSWKYPQDLVNELREIIQDDLRGWSFFADNWYPNYHHGSGATAELKKGAGLASKYFVLDNTLPEEYRQFAAYFLMENYRPTGVSIDDLVSMIAFVPKGIDSKRIIGQEPTACVFVQQAFFYACDKFFDTHKNIGVSLHDQSKSRELALWASYGHNFATIDLSAASDSVTYTLMKYLFEGHPIWEFFKAIRSRKGVLPDDSQIDEKWRGLIIPLEKFMGMGSPSTFPVECWIFSAIIRLAMKHCGVNDYFVVYGDDMIVSKACEKEVISILQALNFKVNLDKSFLSEEWFKESCGIEAFQFKDVSPCRISRRYDAFELLKKEAENRKQNKVKSTHRSDITPKVVGIIEMRNTIWKHGYRTVAKYFDNKLLKYYPLLLYVDNDNQFGLLSKAPKNEHIVNRQNRGKHCMRYNEALQCTEVLTYTLSVRKEKHLSHDLEYREWLHQSYFHPEREIRPTYIIKNKNGKVIHQRASSIYMGSTKDVFGRVTWAANYTVQMSKPIKDIPLAPPSPSKGFIDL
ncbi:TPA_asm: RNA-directed RNA polymerase, partial [ssRNA phage AVE016]